MITLNVLLNSLSSIFNEKFRQLDEISEDSEKLPPSVKLTLLQTAVRRINDLRIIETLDEFQSTTYGHGSSTSLSYNTYYDLLINACVRYNKTKKANIGKRRNVYTTNIDDTYVDHPTACIDHVPNSPYGDIDLPPDEFYQVHTLSLDIHQAQPNSVDDRSVQVGGKQRICTIDGYAMPLTCRGGLMYLSILDKPTDKDLERYPAVHLTGPHEWDPSVFDYTHPSGDGEPPWSNDPGERFALPLILTLMSLEITPKGQYKLSVFLICFNPKYQLLLVIARCWAEHSKRKSG